jgi:hypothetical protein
LDDGCYGHAVRRRQIRVSHIHQYSVNSTYIVKK